MLSLLKKQESKYFTVFHILNLNSSNVITINKNATLGTDDDINQQTAIDTLLVIMQYIML